MGVYIVMFLIGLAIGIGITMIVLRKKPVGSLCVDNSDPDDGPYLFLEFRPDQNPEVIMRKAYVTMKVEVKNYVSHK